MTAADQPDYGVAIWRSKWVIILVTIAGAIGGILYSRLVPPVYRSTAVLKVNEVRLMPPLPASVLIDSQAFLDLIKLPTFTQDVMASASTNSWGSGDQLVGKVGESQNILLVHAFSRNPQRSKQLAESAVKYLSEKGKDFKGDLESIRSQADKDLVRPTTNKIKEMTLKFDEVVKNDPYNTSEKNRIARELTDLSRTNAVNQQAMNTLYFANIRKPFIVIAKPTLPITADSKGRRYFATSGAIGALLGMLLGIAATLLAEGRRRAKLIERLKVEGC